MKFLCAEIPIIERAGKPLAALVNLERFQKLQENQNAALWAARNMWNKMTGAEAQEIQEAIAEAIQAAKDPK